MLTVLWYFIFFIKIKKLHIYSLSSLISLYIFFIISGRIPFPSGNILIETWMIYGLIFFFLNFFFFGNIVNHVSAVIKGDFNKSLEIILVFTFILISLIFSTYGLFKIEDYNIGYFLIFLEIASITMILSIFNINTYKFKLSRVLLSSILTSTLLICFIGIVAQILLFFGLIDCNFLSIYHPEGDIHCIPFSNSFLYRFSIGSNINEFSLYLTISFILLTNNPDYFKSNLIKIPFLSTLNSYNFFRFILFLCILLSLSRAAFLALIIFFIIKLNKLLIRTFYTLKIYLNSYFIENLKFILILVFFLLSIIIIRSDLIPTLGYLFNSRLSFLFEFSNIFEGSSSQARLDRIDYYKDLILSFSFLPLIPLGSGTNLHNSFIQFLLEFGFIPSLFGLFLLIRLSVKKSSFIFPILVFIGSHHVIYNPIIWIYFSSISMLEENDKNKISI